MNKEYRIQVAIIDHLTGRIRNGKNTSYTLAPFLGLFVTHIYQGRTKEDGFFLSQLGVKAGVADILLITKDWIGFMEVKTADGYPSPAQKKFRDLCKAWGHRWCLVRSVKEAHEQLVAWGLVASKGPGKEPDLLSDDQKEELAMQHYGVKKYLTFDDMRAGKVNPEWRG